MRNYWRSSARSSRDSFALSAASKQNKKNFRNNKAKKKIVKKMSLKQSGARIHWGSDAVTGGMPSPSKFVEDKTWIMSYEHRAANFTDLYVKSGSKLMALAGMGESELNLRTSESALVRKYRCVKFFLSPHPPLITRTPFFCN